MKKYISIIVPAFNEVNNISSLVTEINKTLSKTNYNFEIIFIDDGSRDHTLDEIKVQCEIHPHIFYIELSRNFGKDHALKAGLSVAKGNAAITMDADLQHPPELLLEMLKYWENGYDIIYTYRKQANGYVKKHQKLTSKLFYKGINFLSDLQFEDGLSDFRLLDEKVILQLKGINEYEIFFRGIIKWVGFKQIGIPYTPNKRFTGDASYSSFKLMKLAINGIMSFSVKPLYLTTCIGLFFAAMALLYIPYIMISFFSGNAVSGWTSLIATIVFFGGIQLFVLGIIGMYLGKLFMQSKHRPNYIIRSTNVLKINNDLVEF